MDHQQQHIQLALMAWSDSAATQPRDEDDAGSIDMCPLLYRAVHKGLTQVVMAQLMTQLGADIHQGIGIEHHAKCDILEATAEGNTVLHVAAERGHDELIPELYHRFRDKAKALLTRRNSALDTPLHCAARAGSHRTVAALMILAADCGKESILRCKNEAGDMALHLAARHGHGAAVEVLVSKAETAGSELNNAGVSPLYLAVMSGSVQAVKAIISCKDASAAGPSSQNALHAAVFQSEEMVELLLEWRPALADEVDCNGSTPLHFASSDGHHSIVYRILCAAPPKTVYRKDHIGGLSALHVAARMGHDDVVKKLLMSSPDTAELRDDGGETFLHAAAKAKRYSVVSLAVKDPMHRGLLDARDRDGNTPLHHAVAVGAPGIVEILLRDGKVGADVMNDDGHTPFDLAQKSTSFFTMVSLVLILVTLRAQSRPQRQDHLKPWSGQDFAQGIEKARDSLSVVAGLIATAAFAAGFQLPGGYGDDGAANLKHKRAFTCFIVLNTFALSTSVVTVILLVYGKASRSDGSWKSFIAAMYGLWISLNSLMLAFYAALRAAISNRANVYLLMTIYTSIQVLAFIATVRMVHVTSSPLKKWKCLWRSRSSTRQSDIMKRQYPFAAASLRNLILFKLINVIVYVVVLVLAGIK